MTRCHGRCLKGERRICFPHGHRKTTTLVAGLRMTGMVAPMLLDWPINGDRLEADVAQVLVPELRPGNVAIMDNLSSHMLRTSFCHRVGLYMRLGLGSTMERDASFMAHLAGDRYSKSRGEAFMNSVPTKFINIAMSELACMNVLGPANGAKSELEEAFQINLCKILNDKKEKSHWTWEREVGYETSALRNKHRIKIDIVGKHKDGDTAAIELKYVPTGIKNNQASDAPAFPYDLLKDCVKIELIPANQCCAVLHDAPSDITFGYSLGITNVPKILNGNLEGWSKNYHEKIIQRGDGGKFSFGPCLIESYSKNNICGVVYRNKRHHIYLGMQWIGEWFNFGETGSKYVMLSTSFKEARPDYRDKLDDPSIIPFLNPITRSEADRRAAEL